MGAGDSKIAPLASEGLFNEQEKTLLQELFRANAVDPPPSGKSKHEPAIPFPQFQQLLANVVPEGLHQDIYANFIGAPPTSPPSNTQTPPTYGIKYAQFVDGVARGLKGNRLKYYISLFANKGPDISCHTVATILQWDANMWCKLAKIDAYL